MCVSGGGPRLVSIVFILMFTVTLIMMLLVYVLAYAFLCVYLFFLCIWIPVSIWIVKWILTVMCVLTYMLGRSSADRGQRRVHRSKGHAEGPGEGKRSGERYTLSVCAITSLFFLLLAFISVSSVSSSLFFSVTLLYLFIYLFHFFCMTFFTFVFNLRFLTLPNFLDRSPLFTTHTFYISTKSITL